MANEISKLKEYNLEEVSKKTQIPVEYLESIIKGDYAKLINVNVKAYAKIINREYGIDTSGFLSSFEAFMNATSENYEEKVKVNPRLIGYCAQEKSNSLIWLISMLVLMVAGIWSSKILQNLDFSHLVPETIISSDENEQEQIDEEIQENEQIEQEEENETNIDLNDTISLDESNDNNASSENELNEETNTTKEIKSARFTPKKSIWIGIKNLDDMSKRSFNTKKPFDLNLTGKFLVVTGHGSIDLQYGDNSKNYNQKDTLRFYINEGEIKKLKFKEFIKLNKGPLW